MIETLLGIIEESHRKSCLMMALRSARYLTGRDINAGTSESIRDMQVNVLMKTDVTKYWLENEHFLAGITMYLIVIDAVGCIFNNLERACSTGNGIKKALKMFSSLNDSYINALIDLRNSLTHNFGLCTESKQSNGKCKKQKHKFSLDFSDSTRIVTLPIKEWDGDYYLKNEESTTTVIGVFALCDLAENVIKNVYDCYRNGALTLRISENEAKARFTVLV